MFNRCEITIEFDRPDRRYRTGEQVSGLITVDVNNTCRCHGLQVDVEWRTHGAGDRNTGTANTDILFEGEWTPRGVHRYPFSFEIPNGPCTYHGQLFNVDWYVMAHADIDWSMEPREEADFLVEAGENTAHETYLTGEEAGDSGDFLQLRVEKAKAVFGGSTIVGVIFVVLGISFLLVGISDGEIVEGIMYGVLLASHGAAFFFSGLRNRLARRKLGEIQVQIPQKRVRAGEFVEVLLDIPNCSKARLKEITATLTATEVVATGSGTDRSSLTHGVFGDLRYTFEGSVDRKLVKGESAHFSQRFRIPADAPPSFHAQDNDLHWEVEFHVDIAWWPDWKRSLPLEVMPAEPRPLDDNVVEELPLRTEELVTAPRW